MNALGDWWVAAGRPLKEAQMSEIKILLLAAAFLCLASPAMAGWQWQHRALSPAWACGAYEYAKRCNAELNVRTHRCGCIVR